MKNILRNLVLGAVLFSFVPGCTHGFIDTNTNPNSVMYEDLKAKNFLEPLIYDASRTWSYYTWYWCDQIMQYEAFTGTTREEHRYKIGEQDWNSWYTNFLSRWAVNADAMQQAAHQEGLTILEAVAMTLKAYYMANLTDMFGDIPCSEAFMGREGVLKPRYDTQQEVYRQLFELLETANRMYASGESFPSSLTGQDGMFGGDLTGWRKFNNSFYLRCLMRVSGRSVMNAAAKMTEILADPIQYPIFESNADNAAVHYGTTAPYLSYFSETTEQNFNSERRMTKQFVQMTVLSDDDNPEQEFLDPRLPIWAHPDGNRPWKGVISGGDRLDADFQESTRNASKLRYSVFCRNNMPYTLMDYAEVQFIFAEAALKGYIPGGKTAAKGYYQAAIAASIERWNAQAPYAELTEDQEITEEKIERFLSHSAVVFDTGLSDTELSKRIGEQKFLALFWNGMEAWHEFRRTGYPQLEIASGAVYNDCILPTRFAYVQNSIGSNPENAQAAIDRLNGNNDMKQPVWWSKQAIDSNYYHD